ncbi:hypothetical protein AB0K02_11855 [Streptomyces sp. NPDC049597]|uniref:hypothetical protein n=1 Tax=Streptomyces sp. NPDC049597 TaxID=3155276 RepID=UPI00343F08B3
MPPDPVTPDPADRGMNRPAGPAPASDTEFLVPAHPAPRTRHAPPRSAGRSAQGPDGHAEIGKHSPPAPAVRAERPKRARERKEPPETSMCPTAALDGALAAGPSSHTVSPALRSALRWPAAVLLFACGLLHLPTDLAGLRSGGYAQTLSAAVMVLCLACAVWLALRDTLVVWAATAGLTMGVVALHAVASAGMAGLLNSGLGESFTSARAAAVLGAAAGALLTCCSALVRRTRAAGAANGT